MKLLSRNVECVTTNNKVEGTSEEVIWGCCCGGRLLLLLLFFGGGEEEEEEEEVEVERCQNGEETIHSDFETEAERVPEAGKASASAVAARSSPRGVRRGPALRYRGGRFLIVHLSSCAQPLHAALPHHHCHEKQRRHCQCLTAARCATPVSRCGPQISRNSSSSSSSSSSAATTEMGTSNNGRRAATAWSSSAC